MNINIISNQVMLAHSHMWTRDPIILGELGGHPLGAAILAEVKRVHLLLSDTQDRRAEIRKALRRLTKLLADLDIRHDSLGRAIYSFLQALIHAMRSAEDAKAYVDLLDTLFPAGLRVLSLSYLGQAGAMIERTKRVTAPMLELMGRLQFGALTLLDLYKEWNQVAEEIGARAQERASVQVSLNREGTAITAKNTLAVRHEWIAVVSAMVTNLAFIPLSDKTREMLLGPLTRSIEDALARRAAGNAEEGEDVDGDGDIDQDDLDQAGNEEEGEGAEGDGSEVDDIDGDGGADEADIPGDDTDSASASA